MKHTICKAIPYVKFMKQIGILIMISIGKNPQCSTRTNYSEPIFISFKAQNCFSAEVSYFLYKNSKATDVQEFFLVRR